MFQKSDSDKLTAILEQFDPSAIRNTIERMGISISAIREKVKTKAGRDIEVWICEGFHAGGCFCTV